MNASLVVLMKEIKENLRDRRTLLSAFLTGPLLGPVLFVAMMNVMIGHQIDKAQTPLEVPVVGAQYAPNLVSAIKQAGAKIKPAIEHPIAAVHQQQVHLVLRIPKTYAAAWVKGETAQVAIIHDASRRDASTDVRRLKAILNQYIQKQAAMRLLARGLSPSVVRPLRIADRDVSTPQSRGGQLFAFLPYFFIIAIFVGGMYLAIDLTAGERERQSLEPLFVNPIARWKILLGKVGAVSAFAFASVALSIIAFSVAAHFMPTEKIGMALDLGVSFIVQTLVLMLPLVLLFAILQTLVAAFAKSFREAQTYLSILMIVPIIPSALLAILPVKGQLYMYAIPLLGQQIGIVRLIRGQTVTAEQMGLCVLSSLVAAGVLYAITERVYRSERLGISA